MELVNSPFGERRERMAITELLNQVESAVKTANELKAAAENANAAATDANNKYYEAAGKVENLRQQINESLGGLFPMQGERVRVSQ